MILIWQFQFSLYTLSFPSSLIYLILMDLETFRKKNWNIYFWFQFWCWFWEISIFTLSAFFSFFTCVPYSYGLRNFLNKKKIDRFQFWWFWFWQFQFSLYLFIIYLFVYLWTIKTKKQHQVTIVTFRIFDFQISITCFSFLLHLCALHSLLLHV